MTSLRLFILIFLFINFCEALYFVFVDSATQLGLTSFNNDYDAQNILEDHHSNQVYWNILLHSLLMFANKTIIAFWIKGGFCTKGGDSSTSET